MKEKTKLALLILAAKLIYKLMPHGYALEAWSWPNDKGGGGNVVIYTCPKPQNYTIRDALWYIHKGVS